MLCCGSSSDVKESSPNKNKVNKNQTNNAPSSSPTNTNVSSTRMASTNNTSDKPSSQSNQSGIYQSRIKDHNTANPIANVPKDEDVDDFVQEENDDKVAPLPSPRPTQTFHAEVDGVEWTNLYVDPGKSIYLL